MFMKTIDSSNIGNVERAITVLAGAFIMYKALSGGKKQIFPAITGALMILRGVTGHRPASDLTTKLIGR
jgi:hypothetical protein